MSPSPKIPRRPISLLPNALTLANAGLGLLAISKAIDALAGSADQAFFEQNLETACWLILAAGVFDILDGKVARLTNSFSDLGAQLDSLADAVTFGVAPAMVTKVLLEHEGLLHPRVHFICSAAFALMVVLRLARFNAEGDDEHSEFSGLPSPAAAGMLIATVLMFLSLGGAIESSGAQPTPLGQMWIGILPGPWRDTLTQYVLLPGILLLLPTLALLMVSRVRYVHLATRLGGMQNRRALVPIVFFMLGLYLAPVLFLFCFGLWYVGWGLISGLRAGREPSAPGADREAA